VGTLTPQRMDPHHQRARTAQQAYLCQAVRANGHYPSDDIVKPVCETRGTSWVINRNASDVRDSQLGPTVALQPTLALRQSSYGRHEFLGHEMFLKGRWTATVWPSANCKCSR
jgi:hypothetical protein